MAGDATALPIAHGQLVAVAPRTLDVNRRTSFVDLFDRQWVLSPDGCGYRALLGSLAASMQRSIHVVAEVQGASLQRELVLAGLGIGLVPETIARGWTSHRPGGDDLIVIRPKGEPFAITAALISIETTQRLARPVEVIGSALIDVLHGAG